MENLENILKNLPNQRLPRKTDWLIRLRLLKLMLNARLIAFKHSSLYRPAFSVALSAVIILVIFFPVYSYSDQNIVPGDVLYPVKRAVEKLEYLTAIDPVSQAEKSLKFSERRLDEAKKLEETKVSDNKNTAEKSQDKIDTVKEAIKEIESADKIISHAPENNTQAVQIKEKITELKQNNLFKDHKFNNFAKPETVKPADTATSTMKQDNNKVKTDERRVTILLDKKWPIKNKDSEKATSSENISNSIKSKVNQLKQKMEQDRSKIKNKINNTRQNLFDLSKNKLTATSTATTTREDKLDRNTRRKNKN